MDDFIKENLGESVKTGVTELSKKLEEMKGQLRQEITEELQNFKVELFAKLHQAKQEIINASKEDFRTHDESGDTEVGTGFCSYLVCITLTLNNCLPVLN